MTRLRHSRASGNPSCFAKMDPRFRGDDDIVSGDVPSTQSGVEVHTDSYDAFEFDGGKY